ncbi:MAG TPA: hypothetical protein VLZ72_01125 [Flavobacterium sp.]|nr:hypothetical protein [Flavobacterium sp.]
MKKILFVASLFFVLLSCSDNDDKIKNEVPINSISATINGEDFVFNHNITVTKTPHTDPNTGYEYTDIRVLGYIVDDPLRIIEFVAEQGNIGQDAMWRFIITTDGKAYSKENSPFTILVTESSDSVLKGNFYGTLTNVDDGTTISVTSGTFHIKLDQ